MKNLKTSPRSDKYAYVANNVVYNISNVQNSADTCCTEITSANCTPITVTYNLKDSTNKETKQYYLDVYVKDGDLRSSGTFVPNPCHDKNISGGSFSSYTEMYREDAILSVIDNMLRGLSFDVASRDLPLYLKYTSGETFDNAKYSSIYQSSINPIKFNNSDFRNYVKYIAKQNALECANSVLDIIDITIPESALTITYGVKNKKK